MMACKKEENSEETTPEVTTVPEDTNPSEEETPVVRTCISAEELSNYEIIYARNSSQEVKNTEVVNLFNALRGKFDVVLNQRSDLYYEGVASLAKGEYEILIGQTNREESETFLANLKWGDYGYGIVGDKLVIAGKNEDGTLAALRAFIEHINASEDKEVFFDNANQLLLQKEYPHQSLTINGISVSELSILCNEEELGGVAQIIRDAIIDACGVAVPIFTDEELIDAGLDLNLKKVILIGDTACVCIEPAPDEDAYPTGKEYYFDSSFIFCLSITAKNASGYLSAVTDLATQISSSESDNIVIESGKREGSDNIPVMSFTGTVPAPEEDSAEIVIDNDYLYSYAEPVSIKLLKIQKGGTKVLEGAQFCLFADAACTQLVSSAVSDENGLLSFSFTEAGTWYLKELKAPDGYKLSGTVYPVTVSESWVKDVREDNGEEVKVIVQQFSVVVAGLADEGGYLYGIENEPLPPVTVSVTKVFKNDEKLERPDFVEITLYQDGKPIAGVKLSEENNWTHKWTDLPADHEYTVDERVPKGYVRLISRNGNDFVVTNVASYPATGDNAELLPWAFMAMLSLCGAAMLIRKLRRKESE